MDIKTNTGISTSLYAAVQGSPRRQPLEAPAKIPESATQVSISEAAKAALRSSSEAATATTETSAPPKPVDQLNSAELDALQKKKGFVNTWAYLSPAEKALYDKAIASGDSKAAAGLAQIALIRTGGMGAGKDGAPYDARTTEITASNINQYFRHSIIDTDGHSDSAFDALVSFLKTHDTTAA